jgi:hypothetical protein
MRGRTFIRSTAAIGIGTLVVATAAWAGPSMSTRWSEMTLPKDECIEKGRRAVRAEGFTKNFEVVNTTVFGERGDYTAGVRCAVEKEIVFFVVAGPNAKQASSYNAAITERFK